jgi:hypothetical protein
MTDRTAYETMEADEQQRTERPAYPYQPLRGLRYLPGIDISDVDFDPLPDEPTKAEQAGRVDSRPGQ